MIYCAPRMPANDPTASNAPVSKPAETENGEGQPLKIYLLPNLLTAGNLFCGFLALTKIVGADLSNGYVDIKNALLLILLACVFDMLDGRVARWSGGDSAFGREFDSLADVVSFGVVPAFLVHRIVLKEVFGPESGISMFQGHPEIGWFISSIYLLCGAFRLARFNCLATQPDPSNGKEFIGCPIPVAAGAVASITLFLIWWDEKEFKQGNWRYALPLLMVFLSVLMVSKVRYPTFKKFDWRATSSFSKVVIMALVIGFFFILWEKAVPVVMPVIFFSYLIYGFVRPYMTRQMRSDFEED